MAQHHLPRAEFPDSNLGNLKTIVGYPKSKRGVCLCSIVCYFWLSIIIIKSSMLFGMRYSTLGYPSKFTSGTSGTFSYLRPFAASSSVSVSSSLFSVLPPFRRDPNIVSSKERTEVIKHGRRRRRHRRSGGFIR